MTRIKVILTRLWHMIKDDHNWKEMQYIKYCKGCGWLQIKEVHTTQEIMSFTIYRDFSDDLNDSWMTPEQMFIASKELLLYTELGEKKGW